MVGLENWKCVQIRMASTNLTQSVNFFCRCHFEMASTAPATGLEATTRIIPPRSVQARPLQNHAQKRSPVDRDHTFRSSWGGVFIFVDNEYNECLMDTKLPFLDILLGCVHETQKWGFLFYFHL
ncbi:unnamed protein product [Protopolystoma xenopodis]|uniref:Uncharacterized protein n=1 Tax=Protopolystoma xenopodis TaxID=117903 RepID=A0A3S5BX71_9PLAT|nr:unnamed protein product [Protopolystoma xenopodis]